MKTDAEIGNCSKQFNKKLVEFTLKDEEIDPELKFNPEDEENTFDQFELNKEKFNVQTTYSELNYTTALNYNTIPDELKKKAIKIENELTTNTDNSNRHIKEERGLIELKEENEDEEFNYSSVYRTDKK